MALTKVPSNLDATIATTQSQADNSTNIATTAYVDLAVSSLSDSAPAALNTLNEIAAALGDDANYASTTTAAIAAKLPLAGGTMTGNLTVNAIVDADNYTINGGQGSDGQVLTSTGSGVAWEAIPAGGLPLSGGTLTGTLTTPTLITGAYGGSGSAGDGFRLNSTDLYGQIDASDKIRLNVNGVSYINGGNVGIGTPSPSGKLSIHGTTATSEASHITFENTSGAKKFAIGGGKAGVTNNGFSIVNVTDNTSPFHIADTGHVGIGTTSPDYPIHVKGAGHQRIKVEKTDAGGDADISIANRSDGTGWILFTDAQAGSNSGVIKYVHDGDYMSFRTNGTDDRMRITSNGNVGIGNTAPKAPLHIGTLTGGTGTAEEQLRISGDWTQTGSGSLIRFTNQHNSASNPNSGEYNIAGIKAFDFSSQWSGAIALQTPGYNNAGGGNLVDRLLVDPQGFVGIGTSAPGRLLEVSHSAGAHTPVLRLTGSSTSGYAAGLEWYSGYGPKQSAAMYSTASGSQGGEFWHELRNQSSNTLKRIYHVSNAAKHTFHGQHNGDSTGHFLFTNSLYDTAGTNCSLVVQNGYTFIQIMGWTSNGARIGTRTGGWSGNSGGDVYFTRQDATSIKLASSGPQLGNGTAISSDRRLKENITNLADGQLAKINSLTPRTFTWKDTRKPGTHEGFIAQEVEAVIPEAVFEDNFAPDPDDDSRDFEGDIKLIKHEVINARLIKAVQELSAKLEAAEARITTLEG